MKKTISTAQWDAELDSDCCNAITNADLTIVLRVGLRQINPAGGAAEGTYNDYGDATEPARKIIKWTKGSWTVWTDELVKSAQSYWSGRFWLLNNYPVLEYDVRGVKYRPNIYCKLKVVTREVPEIGPCDAHHIIDVVRLHPSVKWFGSHAKLYDSRDTRLVEKKRDRHNKPIMQRAHVHEFGHLLGLGHVDEGKPACVAMADNNASVCYGVADVDKKNVMGGGMARTANLGLPWRRAAAQLTGKGDATVAADWTSHMMRLYPRTPTECATTRKVRVR